MPDIKFNCPRCGQHIGTNDDPSGLTLNCPTCDHEFVMQPAFNDGVAGSVQGNSEPDCPGDDTPNRGKAMPRWATIAATGAAVIIVAYLTIEWSRPNSKVPLRDVRWTVTDKWQTRDGKVEMLQAGIEQGLVLLIVQAKVSMDYFQKPTEFDEYRQVSESSQTSIKEFHTVKLRKGGFSQFLLHVPGTDAAVSAEWYDVEVPADTPIGNATAAFAVSKDQLNVGQISFSYAETNKAALQKGNRW